MFILPNKVHLLISVKHVYIFRYYAVERQYIIIGTASIPSIVNIPSVSAAFKQAQAMHVATAVL